MTAYAIATVDEKNSVQNAFNLISEEINSKAGVPIGNPIFIKSTEKECAFYTAEGEPATEISGVITQAYETGFTENVTTGFIISLYNEDISISDAIKNIETELEKLQGIPMGVITNIPKYEITVKRYDIGGNERKDKVICGHIVQTYKTAVK